MPVRHHTVAGCWTGYLCDNLRFSDIFRSGFDFDAVFVEVFFGLGLGLGWAREDEGVAQEVDAEGNGQPEAGKDVGRADDALNHG